MIRFALVLAFALTLAPFAWAHDSVHPELNSWLMKLRNAQGGQCCDGQDAVSVNDPDWRLSNDHYEVLIDGHWETVPPGNVVPGPNLLGTARVWPNPPSAWSSQRVRCFLPGVTG